VSACPDCDAKGYLRRRKEGYDFVVKCDCRRRGELAKALADAGIPEQLTHLELTASGEDDREVFHRPDDLADPSLAAAHDICVSLRESYIAHFLENRQEVGLHGLLLFGPCGRGKTRLLVALLCDLIRAGVHDVRFIAYAQFFELIRRSYRVRDRGYEHLFAPLVGAKVLVIDDFGIRVSDNATWVRDNIGYVINERYTRNLPTLFTAPAWQPFKRDSSASAPRDQEIAYRLRSRIAEMCLELEIIGLGHPKRKITRGHGA